MNAPRCIVAARVSTPGQEENGTSLESQTMAGEARVKQMGGVVVGYCIEAGVSGSLYQTRSELQSALSRLERKEADVIIWYDLSRMSRDIEYIQVITRRIEEAGAKAVFCMAEYGEGSDGFLARGITGVVSHAERLKIRERTMQGKRRRAEQGVQPNRARSPYGYQIATHRYVIENRLDVSETGKYFEVKKQAAVVRAAFNMVTEQGVSAHTIQKWFYDQGILSPRGNAYWTVDRILAMLRNPVYRGEAGHDATRTRRGQLVGGQGQAVGLHRTKTPERRVPIKVPPIVSEEQWYKAQEIIDKNRSRLGGNPGRKSMLSGILRCPECGNGMVQVGGGGTRRKNGEFRKVYRCGSIARLPKGARCPVRVLDMDRTNTEVLELLWKHISDPALLQAALDKQRVDAERKNKDEERGTTIVALRKEIAALQKREATVVEAQLRAIEVGVTSEIYEQKLVEIGRARASKQEALNLLESAQTGATPKSVQARVRAISSIAEDLRKSLFAPDDEILPRDKHDALTLLVSSITPAGKGLYNIDWRL